jgi:ankyrin repeat protein
METSAPENASPASLMTVALEILHQMATFLAPRDCVHLMLTSHDMYDCIMPFLYRRDAVENRHALRWACHFGELGTLEQSLAFSPPGHANAYFPDGQKPDVAWNKFDSWDGIYQNIDQPPAGDFYDTPLITAVRRQQTAAMPLLFAHGADPNKTDLTRFPMKSSLWGPLHWTMLDIVDSTGFHGVIHTQPPTNRYRMVPNFEVVSRLLEAGADPNKTTIPTSPGEGAESRTPLELATDFHVSVETFKLLLDAGADPTVPSQLSQPTARAMKPLDRLLEPHVKNLHFDKAKLLLDREGRALDGNMLNRNLTCTPGIPLLYHALYHGIDRARQHPSKGELDLALRLAVVVIESSRKQGLPTHIDTMVAEPPMLANGACALHLAAAYDGTAREVSFVPSPIEPVLPVCLRMEEKELRIRERHFFTAVPVIRLLLSEGADPCVASPTGKTAMHIAAHWDSIPAMMALLEAPGAGTLINRADDGGWTPLHWATQFRNRFYKKGIYSAADAVDFLLQRGADVSIRDNQGRTPLDLALQSGSPRPVCSVLRRKHRLGAWRFQEFVVNESVRSPFVVTTDIDEVCDYYDFGSLDNEW